MFRLLLSIIIGAALSFLGAQVKVLLVANYDPQAHMSNWIILGFILFVVCYIVTLFVDRPAWTYEDDDGNAYNDDGHLDINR